MQRQQQKRRCESDCQQHKFQLKGERQQSKYDVSLQFCPKFNRNREPQSTYPLFNNDRRHYTDCFMLGVEFKELQKNETLQYKQHIQQVNQTKEKQCKIVFPKPNKKHTLCSACKEPYDNYRNHIILDSHIEKIKENMFSGYILDLCENFRGLWEGKQQIADQQAIIEMQSIPQNQWYRRHSRNNRQDNEQNMAGSQEQQRAIQKIQQERYKDQSRQRIQLQEYIIKQKLKKLQEQQAERRRKKKQRKKKKLQKNVPQNQNYQKKSSKRQTLKIKIPSQKPHQKQDKQGSKDKDETNLVLTNNHDQSSEQVKLQKYTHEQAKSELKLKKPRIIVKQIRNPDGTIVKQNEFTPSNKKDDEKQNQQSKRQKQKLQLAKYIKKRKKQETLEKLKLISKKNIEQKPNDRIIQISENSDSDSSDSDSSNSSSSSSDDSSDSDSKDSDSNSDSSSDSSDASSSQSSSSIFLEKINRKLKKLKKRKQMKKYKKLLKKKKIFKKDRQRRKRKEKRERKLQKLLKSKLKHQKQKALKAQLQRKEKNKKQKKSSKIDQERIKKLETLKTSNKLIKLIQQKTEGKLGKGQKQKKDDQKSKIARKSEGVKQKQKQAKKSNSLFTSNILDKNATSNALKPKTSKQPIVIQIDDQPTINDKVDWKEALGIKDSIVQEKSVNKQNDKILQQKSQTVQKFVQNNNSVQNQEKEKISIAFQDRRQEKQNCVLNNKNLNQNAGKQSIPSTQPQKIIEEVPNFQKQTSKPVNQIQKINSGKNTNEIDQKENNIQSDVNFSKCIQDETKLSKNNFNNSKEIQLQFDNHPKFTPQTDQNSDGKFQYQSQFIHEMDTKKNQIGPDYQSDKILVESKKPYYDEKNQVNSFIRQKPGISFSDEKDNLQKDDETSDTLKKKLFISSNETKTVLSQRSPTKNIDPDLTVKQIFSNSLIGSKNQKKIEKSNGKDDNDDKGSLNSKSSNSSKNSLEMASKLLAKKKLKTEIIVLEQSENQEQSDNKADNKKTVSKQVPKIVPNNLSVNQNKNGHNQNLNNKKNTPTFTSVSQKVLPGLISGQKNSKQRLETLKQKNSQRMITKVQQSQRLHQTLPDSQKTLPVRQNNKLNQGQNTKLKLPQINPSLGKKIVNLPPALKLPNQKQFHQNTQKLTSQKVMAKVPQKNKILQDEKYANRISTDILSKLTEQYNQMLEKYIPSAGNKPK